MIYICADICFLASLLGRQPNPSAAHRGGPRRDVGAGIMSPLPPAQAQLLQPAWLLAAPSHPWGTGRYWPP